MKVEWKLWWRHVDGVVSCDNGFHLDRDPDYWYFNIDPKTQWEQISEDDPNYVHVDDLFVCEEDAKQEAIDWCYHEEDLLNVKMQRLGIK